MPAPTAPALRPAAVAAELDVSVRTVERLIGAGEIKALRVGRQVRVTRAALDDFLERKSRQHGR